MSLYDWDTNPANNTAEWKRVPSYPGYLVNRNGDVRGRSVPTLKPQLTRDGYHRVLLYNENGPQHFSVHQLVCAAFNGKRPLGFSVNHINGVRADNRAENLEWVTPKQNTQHRRNCGTYPSGEKNSRAKLSEDQARQVMKLRSQGLTYKQIGQQFGVRPSTIGWLVTGKTWKESNLVNL